MKAITTLALSVLCTVSLHGQWLSYGTLVSDTNTHFDWPRVAPDNHGGAYIVYQHMFFTEQNPGQHIFVQRFSRDGRFAWTCGTGGIRISTGVSTNQWALILSYRQYAFIVWNCGQDLRAQKIDTAGTLLWGSGGVRVNLRRPGMSPSIALDSCGGLFVAAYAEDPVVRGNPVWIQRLDSNGRRMWTDTGATVSNRSDFVDPRVSGQVIVICTPLQGSPLVAWTQRASTFASEDRQTYVQRLDESGRPLWKHNGIPMTDIEDDWHSARKALLMVEDGRGGAFIGWSIIDPWDPYWRHYHTMQHVDSIGTRILGSEGRLMLSGSSHDWIGDGQSGLIMVSDDALSPKGPSLMRIRHLNYDLEPLWGDSTGVTIANNRSLLVPVQRDNCWMSGDWPRGIFIIGESKYREFIWAQYVDSAGRCLWGANGIQVTPMPTSYDGRMQEYSDIATTAPGEAVVVWHDVRNGYGEHWTIQAAKLNRDGLVGVYALAAPGTASPSLQLRAPYPQNAGTMISGETSGSGILSLMIYDLQGRRMGPASEHLCDPGTFSFYLDTSGLSAGSYFIQAVQGGSTVSMPLLITGGR